MISTEEITWHRIRQKDIQAFEAYYKEHYKEFFLVSCKYVKEPSTAQEIVNDVFVKIWEDAEKITIETSLKSYLYRAVINRSINTLNKQNREFRNRKELTFLQDEHHDTKEMELNELKVQLFKAVDALPDQCKKVFLMSRFDGLKQQEIADKLGISIKTVKNHITHALKQLSRSTGYSAIMLTIFLNDFFKQG